MTVKYKQFWVTYPVDLSSVPVKPAAPYLVFYNADIDVSVIKAITLINTVLVVVFDKYISLESARTFCKDASWRGNPAYDGSEDPDVDFWSLDESSDEEDGLGVLE